MGFLKELRFWKRRGNDVIREIATTTDLTSETGTQVSTIARNLSSDAGTKVDSNLTREASTQTQWKRKTREQNRRLCCRKGERTIISKTAELEKFLEEKDGHIRNLMQQYNTWRNNEESRFSSSEGNREVCSAAKNQMREILSHRSHRSQRTDLTGEKDGNRNNGSNGRDFCRNRKVQPRLQQPKRNITKLPQHYESRTTKGPRHGLCRSQVIKEAMKKMRAHITVTGDHTQCVPILSQINPVHAPTPILYDLSKIWKIHYFITA